jgi:hypothetical protein
MAARLCYLLLSVLIVRERDDQIVYYSSNIKSAVMSIGKYLLEFRSSLIQPSTGTKESEVTYFTLRALRRGGGVCSKLFRNFGINLPNDKASYAITLEFLLILLRDSQR